MIGTRGLAGDPVWLFTFHTGLHLGTAQQKIIAYQKILEPSTYVISEKSDRDRITVSQLNAL